MSGLYGRLHRFEVIAEGMHIAFISSVEGLGNTGEVYLVPYPGGKKEPHLIGAQAKTITFKDALVDNKDWYSWFITSWLTPDDDGARRTFHIDDLETGAGWEVLSAIPVDNSVSYNRGEDGIPMITVSITGEIVERDGAGSSLSEPLFAYLGSENPVVLMIPGSISMDFEAQYAGNDVPGIEADNSEWVGSDGMSFSIPFHLVGSKERSVDEDYQQILALAKKKVHGYSPEIVPFVYGETSKYVAVKSVNFEEIHRKPDGKVHIAKGTLKLQERYLPGTGRTIPELKGLGIYETVGDSETYHSIAYALWGDELLWKALRDWNPMPFEAGPCLAAGTVFAIPPYEFVQRYRGGA